MKTTHNGSFPKPEKMEQLLIEYLVEKYGLKRETLREEEELVVAKSIFYNFVARRQDDTLGHSDIEKMRKTRVKFCERGTKK